MSEQPINERVHFVGIGGIHMSGLARILLEDGAQVSGSDRTDSALLERLRAKGAEVSIGNDAAHVAGADLVVRTIAVPDENPEIVAARAAGIMVLSRAEMVARIAEGRPTLAVSGSHGKTTTATMATLILRAAGRDVGYVLGGEAPELESHARRGADPWIVLEADEYGRAFHHYQPSVAVITNIERDHLDYYGSDEGLFEAFLGYARTLQPNGTLIVGRESACARSAAERLAAERSDFALQTFALQGEATWTAHEIREDAAGTSFKLLGEGGELGALRLAVPGEHNVRNALAAVAAASAAGAGIEAAERALAEFRGVARRFQPHGEAGGVLVLDDYAHHPTEIRATIEAARARFASRRLAVLFQPHTYTRSQYLLEDFRGCFQGVDLLFLCETYAAREDPSQGLSAEQLAAEVTEPPARYAGSLEEAPRVVAAELRTDDVVITMGAGDVDSCGPALLEILADREVAR